MAVRDDRPTTNANIAISRPVHAWLTQARDRKMADVGRQVSYSEILEDMISEIETAREANPV